MTATHIAEVEAVHEAVAEREPTDQERDQIHRLEADFDVTLVGGSIKRAMKEAEAKSRDLWQLDPFKLRVIEGFNPRIDTPEYRAHIRALADSMKAEGFYADQPLAGYVAKVGDEEVIYIYSGHSRLQAVKIAIAEGAEILRVPVVVSQDGVSMEDLTVALVRGNSGKNLTYYESAIVCKRLSRYGMAVEEIAERTGIALPLVKNRLKLMAAPLRLREMVAVGAMSATLALDMIEEYGDQALEQAEAAKQHADVNGKAKVRKIQAAKSERLKFVTKRAPKLYEAAATVRRDPAYAQLSMEVREMLEGLLAEIEAKQDAPVVDPRQISLIEGGQPATDGAAEQAQAE